MNRFRHQRRPSRPPFDQRGQSLTEMAIFITLLMLVLAGVIDLGRAYYSYLSLKDAAACGEPSPGCMAMVASR